MVEHRASASLSVIAEFLYQSFDCCFDFFSFGKFSDFCVLFKSTQTDASCFADALKWMGLGDKIQGRNANWSIFFNQLIDSHMHRLIVITLETTNQGVKQHVVKFVHDPPH